MKKFKTHYDNLQVSQLASDIVIRAAFRGLSQKYHPDKNLDDVLNSERVMKIINEAYAVLSNPKSRKEHDEWIKLNNNLYSETEPKQTKKTKEAREAREASNEFNDYSERPNRKTNKHEFDFEPKNRSRANYSNAGRSDKTRSIFDDIEAETVKETNHNFEVVDVKMPAMALPVSIIIGSLLLGYYLLKETVDDVTQLRPEPSVSAQQMQYDISRASPEPLEANHEEASELVQSSVAASENPSNMISNGQVIDTENDVQSLISTIQEIPELQTRVTDLTQTFTDEQKSLLEEKLAAFEHLKGSQIAVLILPTTQPEDISELSVRVANSRGLGRANLSDGVLILVAKNDRKIRIAVGSGLEDKISNSSTKHIIDEILPSLKQGDYYTGINDAVNKLIFLIANKQLETRPSFDCNKANSTSEILICNDQELAKLDSDLAETYQKAKSITMNDDAFKEAAKAAWKWRESFCRDKECLVKWYIERNDELLKIIQGGVF